MLSGYPSVHPRQFLNTINLEQSNTFAPNFWDDLDWHADERIKYLVFNSDAVVAGSPNTGIATFLGP